MCISSAKPILSPYPISKHLSSSIIAFTIFLLISASIVIHAFSFSGQNNRPSPSFTGSGRAADAFRVASYQCRRQKLVETTIASNNNKNEPMLALKRVAEVLREAAAHNIDLVVFPEMFFSFASGGIGDHSSAVQSDRYELNIVGDLCAELGVACVLPYMERAFKEKTGEGSNDERDSINNSNTNNEDDDTSDEFYSAVKIWSSDGKTAGNIRAIIPPSPPPQKGLLKPQPKFLSSGHPSFDMEPITINLDNPETPQIKCGIIIGFNDIERPEQARHLARKGVDLLIVPSLGGKTQRHEGLTVANHVIPTRAMENSVYVAYAAYEGDDEQYGEAESIYGRNIHASTRSTYVGSSSVIAPDGSFLVKGPTCFGGKIPQTEGYVLSLGGDEVSAAGLYAADVSLKDSIFVERKMMNNPCEDGSLDLWEMVPRKGPVSKWRKANEKRNVEMKSSSANSRTSNPISSNSRSTGNAGSTEVKRGLETRSSQLSEESQHIRNDDEMSNKTVSSSNSPSTSTPLSSDSRFTRDINKLNEKKGPASPSVPSFLQSPSLKSDDGRMDSKTRNSNPSPSPSSSKGFGKREKSMDKKGLNAPSTQSSEQKQFRKKDDDM
mmetsp:Transcript_14083/g.19273  ORF Transcript_14083/g.19273 Transcript_14083/m.19273 type:complete len:608 (-) Transcript_14083:147-1970(-)